MHARHRLWCPETFFPKFKFYAKLAGERAHTQAHAVRRPGHNLKSLFHVASAAARIRSAMAARQEAHDASVCFCSLDWIRASCCCCFPPAPGVWIIKWVKIIQKFRRQQLKIMAAFPASLISYGAQLEFKFLAAALISPPRALGAICYVFAATYNWFFNWKSLILCSRQKLQLLNSTQQGLFFVQALILVYVEFALIFKKHSMVSFYGSRIWNSFRISLHLWAWGDLPEISSCWSSYFRCNDFKSPIISEHYNFHL